MAQPHKHPNVDPVTVEGFGDEWSAFDQTQLSDEHHAEYFDSYFSIFPFGTLPAGAEGFDLGCGSGRWAAGVADRVGLLHCIDPSTAALDVARRRLKEFRNVRFHLAGANDLPLDEDSQDFGYSLGVLHHVPDTKSALAACVAKLKPNAPFLLYLYYSMDNRPAWYRMLWRVTEFGRRSISRLPFAIKRRITDLIALGVYWPMARLAALAESRGAEVRNFPLSFYREASLYTMRTDALDRFGTRLEHRYSRSEIRQMMEAAGLTDIQFRDAPPFWTACGRRAA